MSLIYIATEWSNDDLQLYKLIISLGIFIFLEFITNPDFVKWEDKPKSRVVIENILQISRDTLQQMLGGEIRAHVALMGNDKYFSIDYQVGMDHDSDRDINLMAGQGLMGLTWNKAKDSDVNVSSIVELNLLTPEEIQALYNMPSVEQDKVKTNLAWIHTRPLYYREKNENKKYLIGLLTFDSTQDLATNSDEKQKMIDIIESMSNIVAVGLPRVILEFRRAKNKEKIPSD